MSKRLHLLVTGLLLLALPSLTLMADSASAVLYASGNVNVNGSAVNRSVTVFDGDTIHTAANSAGTLALKGTSIVVQGGSTVVFTRSGLRLDTGAASVKTTQGVTASIGGYLVAPAEMNGRFAVIQSGSQITVAALEGALRITGAGRNFAVKPGQSLSLALSEATQGSGCVDNKKVDAVGTFIRDSAGNYIACKTETGSAPQGDNSGGGGGGTNIALIGGVAGAVAAGVIAAVIINQQSSSPVGP